MPFRVCFLCFCLTEPPDIKHNTNIESFGRQNMKRSSLFLAMLVLTPSLYAQTENPLFTREQILDVFTRFNPAALERAEQHEKYKIVLEEFLSGYRAQATADNEIVLIGAVRNFDTSIRLHLLTQIYKNKWHYFKMTGQPLDALHRMFAEDVSTEIANVWAVTVQLWQYRLDRVNAELRELRNDQPERKQQLQREKAAIKAQIRALTKNPGQRVTENVEQYIASIDRDLEKENFSVENAIAGQTAAQARASTNLQIKSKNKKPVAK